MNMSRLMANDSLIIISSDKSWWIISTTGVGSMIGSLIGAVFADTFGRKKTLLLTSFFYITGWLVDIFSTKAVELFVARGILGIGIGIAYTTNPLYVSEIADINIRGALSTLMVVNDYAGSVFVCSVGPFVSIKTLSIILIMFPILFFCLFVWFPETPYFLASKQNYDKATESLAFFRGISNPEEAKKELEALILSTKQHSENQDWTSKLRDMLLPNNRKALGIIICLSITQVMSGITPTLSYVEVLFRKSNIGIETHVATVIVLLAALFASTLTMMIIEKVGRRTLLLTSTLGTCVVLLVLASYLYLDSNGVDMTSVNWLPVLFIVLFQMTYYIGIGPVPVALIGELFPTNVKSIGSAVSIILDGVLGFITAMLYRVIGDSVGEYVMYYVFAGSCFLGFLFSLVFVPETMNKQFHEIQEELADTRFRCFKNRNKV